MEFKSPRKTRTFFYSVSVVSSFKVFFLFVIDFAFDIARCACKLLLFNQFANRELVLDRDVRFLGTAIIV